MVRERHLQRTNPQSFIICAMSLSWGAAAMLSGR